MATQAIKNKRLSKRIEDVQDIADRHVHVHVHVSWLATATARQSLIKMKIINGLQRVAFPSWPAPRCYAKCWPQRPNESKAKAENVCLTNDSPFRRLSEASLLAPKCVGNALQLCAIGSINWKSTEIELKLRVFFGRKTVRELLTAC